MERVIPAFILLCCLSISCLLLFAYIKQPKAVDPKLQPNSPKLDPKNNNAELLAPNPTNSAFINITKKKSYSNYSNNTINMVAMSSKYRALLIINNNIILDKTTNGLYIVTFNNDSLDTITEFDITSQLGIKQLNTFIKTIENKNIIILSKGNIFTISNYPINLDSIGVKTKIFRPNDNFLFIKFNNNYYEKSSYDTVYYPSVDITNVTCKKNPNNIKYPEKYYIYNDKTYDVDKVNKCALESVLRNTVSFGIIEDNCIPLSKNNYDELAVYEDSDKCVSGEGNNMANAISLYTGNATNFKENGVNFGNFMLDVGEHSAQTFNKNKIGKITIPDNYFVFLITDTIKPLYGTQNAELEFDQNKIKKIIIQKHFEGNSIVGNDQVYLTFSKGINVLPVELHIPILYVSTGSSNKVSLYSDVYYQNLIGDFYGPEPLKVLFPRVVRSVIVN